jgi:hypothetical protein
MQDRKTTHAAPSGNNVGGVSFEITEEAAACLLAAVRPDCS